MPTEIVYRRGEDFEAAAIGRDDFQTLEQLELTARALEAAGFLQRRSDEGGREMWVVVRDVTSSDLAAVITAAHKRMEEGG